MAKPIINPSTKLRAGKLGKEYFKTISTMLTSAFGLVAALEWNDLIKRVIDRYISPGSGVISQLIYAVIVTTLLVAMTVEMGKIAEKFADEEEKKE